jgi:hypothetical protein
MGISRTEWGFMFSVGQVFQLTPTLNLLEVRHKLGSQPHFKQVRSPHLSSFRRALVIRTVITPPRIDPANPSSNQRKW